MAIAFDSSLSTVTHSSPTSPTSDTFTNTAGTLMLVGISARTQGDLITGVTYNSVAMTLVTKLNTALASAWIYVFKLSSPATGANTIAVSWSGTLSDVRVTAVSYSGAADVEVNNTGSQATATSWSGSITTLTDNDWLNALVWNDVTSNTATAPAVIRGTADDPNFLDSNAAETPAGSHSIGGGIVGGGSANFAWIMSAIKPTGAAATTVPLKSLLGVGL